MKQHRIILHVVPCDEPGLNGRRYKWKIERPKGWPKDAQSKQRFFRKLFDFHYPRYFKVKRSAVRDAVFIAKTLLWQDRQIPAQVIIHNRDGKISREYSYGCDSRAKG